MGIPPAAASLRAHHRGGGVRGGGPVADELGRPALAPFRGQGAVRLLVKRAEPVPPAVHGLEGEAGGLERADLLGGSEVAKVEHGDPRRSGPQLPVALSEPELVPAGILEVGPRSDGVLPLAAGARGKEQQDDDRPLEPPRSHGSEGYMSRSPRAYWTLYQYGRAREARGAAGRGRSRARPRSALPNAGEAR